MKDQINLLAARNHLRDQNFLVRTAFFSMLLCFVLTVGMAVLCILHARKSQGEVYVLENGSILEARRTDARRYRSQEVQDHVRMFHEFLFNLSPQAEAVEETLERAYRLSDRSVYDYATSLQNEGYYSTLISENISQFIQVDSVHVGWDYPYQVRTYGRVYVMKHSTMAKYSIATSCQVVDTPRSRVNPHGLMVENFKVESTSAADARLR